MTLRERYVAIVDRCTTLAGEPEVRARWIGKRAMIDVIGRWTLCMEIADGADWAVLLERGGRVGDRKRFDDVDAAIARFEEIERGES